jgi:GT2 family glycosyltransferase
MDISIIILNYKSKGFAMSCIKSVKEADFLLGGRKLHYEIIAVDNNSRDGLGEILAWQHPDVKFVQNGRNIGMGAGNNAGIKKAKGDYIAIVNPDIIVFKDTFKCLYEYMEKNKNVGVVGPMQLNPDKSVQDSCYRWPGLFMPLYRRTPLGKFEFATKDTDKYLMKDFDHKSEREVDWLLGSFLFCRAEALKQAGMFDERYFLYFEDTDLCRSFWKKNWKVIYYPKVQVIHNHTRQSAKEPWYKAMSNPAARQHIVSWGRYIAKWGGK